MQNKTSSNTHIHGLMPKIRQSNQKILS